jgi:hypothetical protein
MRSIALEDATSFHSSPQSRRIKLQQMLTLKMLWATGNIGKRQLMLHVACVLIFFEVLPVTSTLDQQALSALIVSAKIPFLIDQISNQRWPLAQYSLDMPVSKYFRTVFASKHQPIFGIQTKRQAIMTTHHLLCYFIRCNH